MKKGVYEGVGKYFQCVVSWSFTFYLQTLITRNHLVNLTQVIIAYFMCLDIYIPAK